MKTADNEKLLVLFIGTRLQLLLRLPASDDSQP